MDELLQSAYTASKPSNGVIYITFEDHGGSGGVVQPAAVAPDQEDSVDNKVEAGKRRKEISEDEMEDEEVVFAEE